jgi:hypothetical protein
MKLIFILNEPLSFYPGGVEVSIRTPPRRRPAPAAQTFLEMEAYRQ